jgi:hypothetical protein
MRPFARGRPTKLKAFPSDTLADSDAKTATREIAQAKRDRGDIVREGRDNRLEAESQGRADEAEAQ